MRYCIIVGVALDEILTKELFFFIMSDIFSLDIELKSVVTLEHTGLNGSKYEVRNGPKRNGPKYEIGFT